MGGQRLLDPAGLRSQTCGGLLPGLLVGHLQRFPRCRIEPLADVVGQQLVEQIAAEAILPGGAADHHEPVGVDCSTAVSKVPPPRS